MQDLDDFLGFCCNFILRFALLFGLSMTTIGVIVQLSEILQAWLGQ
jgi:hypothetical protein